MTYALSHPSASRRSSLLGIVIGAHAGLALLLLAARTVAPQVTEIPLIVDLLQPVAEAPREAQPKPLPATKLQPAAPKPQSRTPQPPVEASNSTLPAPAASLATSPEPSPTSPGPAAEPVTQARFDADYLRNPAPRYPPLSKRLGEEGKVVLRVSVTPLGTAESVEVKTSSGSQRLDEAAVGTVRTWKFVPAKRGDTAVSSWVLVPIIFKLEQ